MAVLSVPLALTMAVTPVVGRPDLPVLPAFPSFAPTALVLSPNVLTLTPSVVPSATPSLMATSVQDPSPRRTRLDARGLNSFWDGFAPAPDLVEVVVERPSLPLGLGDDDESRVAPWLATSDRKVGAALDQAVLLASRTRAGEKALDDAEAVLRDRPLAVVVKDLGRNYGEFDYVKRKLYLDRALFAPGRESDLAGTVVHELTHVVQHAQGVPSSALEMELEAHLQDLEMLRELGLEPPKGTFARQAYDALKKSPEDFIATVANAVPGLVFLGEQSVKDVIEQLESDYEDALDKGTKSGDALAAVIASDIALLRTKKGKESYKAFSRRVLALVALRSAALRS